MRKPRTLKNWDWAKINEEFQAGAKLKDLWPKYQMNSQAWDKAKKRGLLYARPKKSFLPLLIHAQNGKRSPGYKLKAALLELGRLYRCEECGIQPTWNGKTLVIQVDHREETPLTTLQTISAFFVLTATHRQKPFARKTYAFEKNVCASDGTGIHARLKIGILGVQLPSCAPRRPGGISRHPDLKNRRLGMRVQVPRAALLCYNL